MGGWGRDEWNCMITKYASAAMGVQSTEYRLQLTMHWVQRTQYILQSTDCVVQHTDHNSLVYSVSVDWNNLNPPGPVFPWTNCGVIYLYMWVYKNEYGYVYKYIYVYMTTCVCVFIELLPRGWMTPVRGNMQHLLVWYAHLYLYIYICVCVRMYEHVYAHIYIYIYI